MKKELIAIGGLVLLLAGCENDLAYQFDDGVPRLMATGFLYQGAEEQTVHVSLSADGQVDGVHDATIHCFVNGQWAASGTAVSENRGKSAMYRQLPVRFQADFAPGDKVRLELEADGGKYKARTPEMTVPLPPLVGKVDTMEVVYVHSDWSEEAMQFMVTLQDRKGEDNWFALNLEKTVSATFSFQDGRPDLPYEWNSIPSISHSSLQDPVLLDGNMSLTDMQLDMMDYLGDGHFETFSDALFRDGSTTLKFATSLYIIHDILDIDQLYSQMARENGDEVGWYAEWPPRDYRRSIRVKVYGCDRDTYFYLRSLRTIQSEGYSPVLMEPVTLPQNIEDGAGFVGILSPDVTTFSLPTRNYTDTESF